MGDAVGGCVLRAGAGIREEGDALGDAVGVAVPLDVGEGVWPGSNVWMGPGNGPEVCVAVGDGVAVLPPPVHSVPAKADEPPSTGAELRTRASPRPLATAVARMASDFGISLLLFIDIDVPFSNGLTPPGVLTQSVKADTPPAHQRAPASESTSTTWLWVPLFCHGIGGTEPAPNSVKTMFSAGFSQADMSSP